jgi:hypothetical protein
LSRCCTRCPYRCCWCVHRIPRLSLPGAVATIRSHDRRLFRSAARSRAALPCSRWWIARGVRMPSPGTSSPQAPAAAGPAGRQGSRGGRQCHGGGR